MKFPNWFLVFWAALWLLSGCGPAVVEFDPDQSSAADDPGETGNGDSGETGTPVADADGDGWTVDAGDCNDAEANVHPEAAETCNLVDDDCDGETDEDPVDGDRWYADADGDGYGNVWDLGGVLACDQPAGYAAQTGDCNEGDPDINPEATEICDGQDNNCDWFEDEGVTILYYADVDGDGYGDASLVEEACEAPTGYVEDSTDCADTREDINPGEVEQCDGLTTDENCNGLADDEDPTVLESGKSHLYHDADGDGYGDPATDTMYCASPDSSWIGDSSDCDDSNSEVNPDVPEVCNGSDDDCDGVTDEDDSLDAAVWFADSDGDGYGNVDVYQLSCSAAAGYVADITDCNDSDSSINPGAVEVCDTQDNNCDSQVDEDSAVDAGTWYADADGDSYGETRLSQVSCTQPSGYVEDDTDCNDSDWLINPEAAEICDSADNDCDGTTDVDAEDASWWYEDDDGDGYGNFNLVDWSCDQPTGYVAGAGDYDDGNVLIHYSPCQESWVRMGRETQLYTPEYGDSSISLTVSTSVDYLNLVWEDSAAPSGSWIVCTEASGLTGTVYAPSGDTYYASAWNQVEEGTTWHWDYVTDLTCDGMAFYSQGNFGDAQEFTSAP